MLNEALLSLLSKRQAQAQSHAHNLNNTKQSPECVSCIPQKRSGTMKFLSTIFAVVIVVAAISTQTNASIITLTTADGIFMNDQPVDAQVTFETGTDSITVIIENLQADPTSVVQNISGLLFTIDTGQTDGTLVSSSGLTRIVFDDETYTDGSVGDTGWELELIDDAMHLHVLGTDAGPAHTIIGPPNASDLYSNANGSITMKNGKSPHNPFIAQEATFVLNVPGVTADSSIATMTLEFNTSPGSTYSTPEPATMILIAAGLPLLLKRRRV